MTSDGSATHVVLAVVNFAQTAAELYSSDMRDFRLTTEAVYRQAETVDGHIASARPQDTLEHLSFFERDWGRWGPFQVPYYYQGGTRLGNVYEASALSVWRDLEALYRFVYAGSHLKGIKSRHRWFTPMDKANYAMWWTRAWPTWAEGARRLEMQQEQGVTKDTFTFKELYDGDGKSLALRDVIAAAAGAE